MPKKTDFDRLSFDFRQFLIKQGGRTTRHASGGALNISQSTFSRLIQRLSDEILVAGSGRAVQYALKRNIPEVGFFAPVFEVDENGKTSPIGNLHSLEPQGFYWEGKQPGYASRFFPDLPYFMEDLRPGGFLGRMIPKRYPDLGGPEDIRYWNSDHCLKYFTRYGWDLIGNLVIGLPAFERHLKNFEQPTALVSPTKRPEIYARMAEQVLREGPAGSSAGGEQPKFLAVRGSARKTPVIVKFSPPLGNPAGQRWADLLIAEHLAHQILNSRRMASLDSYSATSTHSAKKFANRLKVPLDHLVGGPAALKSEIIKGGKRLFLETERFDRIGLKGRRGVVSLFAVSMEYTGVLGSWTEMAQKLARQKIIDETLLKKIRWLDLFGDLIANTDKHPSNLSFFTRSLKIENLAPVYDMLPMLYRPEHGQILERRFEPPLPNPAEAEIWSSALTAALDFWRVVEKHPEISGSFRKTAKGNFKRLKEVQYLI